MKTGFTAYANQKKRLGREVMMKKIEGGVTAASGFAAAAAEAQIKYKGRTDMALVYSTVPAQAAGAFTTNVVKAAPVLWDKEQAENAPFVQAVIVNSGIANACTGAQGRAYCEETAQAAAAALHIPENAVLLGSTGVIGMQLPMDRIKAGVAALAAAKEQTREAGLAAAKAIMTTDTYPKETAYTFSLGGRQATMGGMSKGSGMIHPNMCTMLAYITTDAAIDKALLQKALQTVVPDTFNMISVDGDTSTNDTVLVLSNGLAGNEAIADERSEDYAHFLEVLKAVCTDLAKMQAGDGEGATKLVEARVVHADTKEHAKILAKSVICSNLTKAAMYGNDANWGRILCALGYAGVPFDPERVDLRFEGDAEDGGKSILIYTNGAAAPYSEEEATKLLSGKEVHLVADMHMGEAEATAWGCDLTYDYVKINADYRS